MSLRSTTRDEFPRGWWRSISWWFAGLRAIALSCLVALATVLFVGEMRRVVRKRDHPWELMHLKGSIEGFVGGFMINVAGLGAVVAMIVTRPSENDRAWLVIVAGAMALWCLTNATVACAVLVVVSRSRLRRRDDWRDIDSSRHTHRSTTGRRRRSRSIGPSGSGLSGRAGDSSGRSLLPGPVEHTLHKV